MTQKIAESPDFNCSVPHSSGHDFWLGTAERCWSHTIRELSAFININMAGVQRQFASRAHVTQGFPLSLRVCRFAQRPPLSAKAGALAAMVCLAAMGRPAAASLSFDTCRPLSNPRHAFHVLASVAPDAQPAPNFRLFRVTGDGACMFRSIAQGAQILSRGDEWGHACSAWRMPSACMLAYAASGVRIRSGCQAA